jgi:hypothetical protein
VRYCKLNECAVDFKNHTNMMPGCRTFTGKDCGPDSSCTTIAVCTLPLLGSIFDAVCILILISDLDISDEGKDEILTKSAAGRPRRELEGAKGLSWMTRMPMSHYSLRSGLEWSRHVHSYPLDLEWASHAHSYPLDLEWASHVHSGSLDLE